MISSTLLTLLSVSVPATVGAPLLGGVLGTVSGLTGTHISGSGVTSMLGGATGSGGSSGSDKRAGAAGALAPVTNLAGPVVGTVSGAVAPVASVAIGAAAPVLATTTNVVGTVSSVVGLPALREFDQLEVLEACN